MNGPVIPIPAEVLEQIAQRSAEITIERLQEAWAPRWLYGAEEAARYLGWPVKRVNNRIGELPVHRNGGGLMFNTSELDAYVREHG